MENTQLIQEFVAALSKEDFEKAARLLAQGVDINRVIPTTVPDERGVYENTTTYLIEAAVSRSDCNRAISTEERRGSEHLQQF
jgi:hypothetical protein